MRSSAWSQKTKGRDAAWQRPSLFVLAGAGLLLLGMLTGFYLFFPAEALRQRFIQEIETRTGAEVQIGQMALYPLLTLDASQITFGVTGLPGNARLQVNEVWRDTPAARAGMQVGDVILEVNGKKMKDGYDILRVIFNHAVGEKVRFLIERDEKRLPEIRQPFDFSR